MEFLSEKSEHAVSLCDSLPPPSSNSELVDESRCSMSGENMLNKNEVEETTNSMDEDGILNKDLLARGPRCPKLQKIINLRSIIQNLKKEHASLSDEAKGWATDSFPGLEAINMLQHLSREHELLRKKYLEESCERKCLYNEVIELKGNIRVFCRCRPLNEFEIANGLKKVLEFGLSQDNEIQIISSDYSKKQFKFDHVFNPEDDQDAVFAQTKPIVTSVLDGYNVCIFAYGQTGTGKTFTMEGTPGNRGVNYRTLEELFRLLAGRKGIMRYELSVSMLEVYNEKIKDLLVENSNEANKKLEIKQAAEGIKEVPGLVEACVHSTEEAWELLKSGSLVRSVGSTSANELSSRSHCLLRVTVKGDNLINGQKTKSHLWLVDLAGSERIGKIDVEGERLKESQFINKSLSALGDVISALASKTGYIPYRNSKLTHLLQSSLGGDCKTLMFVQVSPSSGDLGETLCSLNFASRVRGIESGPARKQTDVTELFKYKQMAEKLRHDERETKKLEDNVQSLQLRLAGREQICRSLQEKVRDLENQLADERKTRLKQETKGFAAAAATFSSRQAPVKTMQEKKPPLVPSKLRMPLRRITNVIPQASSSFPPCKTATIESAVPAPTQDKESPLPACKTTTTKLTIPAPAQDKENVPRITTAASTKGLMIKPRRMSVAVRPSGPSKTSQVLKRRVSIATLKPDPSSYKATPLDNPNGSTIGRPSLPKRKARSSNMFSPLPEYRTEFNITMPNTTRSSSKLTGSPLTQAGSLNPKHPIMVARQRKSLVWSPLRMRNLQNQRRPSMFPYRLSTDNQ